MRGQAAVTLFQSLPPEVLAKLAVVGTLKTFADRQLICSRGALDRELNILEQGAVRVSNVDLEGKRTETAILEPGDSFGEFTLLAGTPRFFDFYAHGQTHIRCINKRQFDALMQEDGAFRDGVLSMLTHRLLSAVSIIEDMRRLPLPAQLAKFLVHCAERQDDQHWQYRGTQADLADALGVSRVAIGQALKVLQKQSLVRTGYGCVHLVNKARLQSWLTKQSSWASA